MDIFVVNPKSDIYYSIAYSTVNYICTTVWWLHMLWIKNASIYIQLVKHCLLAVSYVETHCFHNYTWFNNTHRLTLYPVLFGAAVAHPMSQAIGITMVLKPFKEDDMLENKLSVAIGDVCKQNVLIITDLQYVASVYM